MGDDVHHADVFEEFPEPGLVEIGLVEEAERGGHGILGNDIRRESSIGQAKRHGLPRAAEPIHPLTQLLHRLLDDFLLETEDIATREVGGNGRSAGFVQVMLDRVGRRMGMSKLLRVPTVLIQRLVIVDLVVESRVVDVQFVRIDPDDWPCLHTQRLP